MSKRQINRFIAQHDTPLRAYARLLWLILCAVSHEEALTCAWLLGNRHWSLDHCNDLSHCCRINIRIHWILCDSNCSLMQACKRECVQLMSQCFCLPFHPSFKIHSNLKCLVISPLREVHIESSSSPKVTLIMTFYFSDQLVTNRQDFFERVRK